MFQRNGHKYNAKPTIINNISFRSQLEARVYKYLIDNNYNIVEMEPVFELQTSFTYEGKKYRSIIYKSDFLISYDDVLIIVEAKGMLTPEYKLKKKLFLNKIGQFEKEYSCKLLFLEVKSIKDLDCQLLNLIKDLTY